MTGHGRESPHRKVSRTLNKNTDEADITKAIRKIESSVSENINNRQFRTGSVDLSVLRGQNRLISVQPRPHSAQSFTKMEVQPAVNGIDGLQDHVVNGILSDDDRENVTVDNQVYNGEFVPDENDCKDDQPTEVVENHFESKENEAITSEEQSTSMDSIFVQTGDSPTSDELANKNEAAPDSTAGKKAGTDSQKKTKTTTKKTPASSKQATSPSKKAARPATASSASKGSSATGAKRPATAPAAEGKKPHTSKSLSSKTSEQKKADKVDSAQKSTSVKKELSTKGVSKSATSSKVVKNSVSASKVTTVTKTSTTTTKMSTKSSAPTSKSKASDSADGPALSKPSPSQNKAKPTSAVKSTPKPIAAKKTTTAPPSASALKPDTEKKATAPTKTKETSVKKASTKPSASVAPAKKQTVSSASSNKSQSEKKATPPTKPTKDKTASVSKDVKKDKDIKPAKESAKKPATTASKPKDKRPDTKNGAVPKDAKKPAPSKTATKAAPSKAAPAKPAIEKPSAKVASTKPTGAKSAASKPSAKASTSKTAPGASAKTKPTAKVQPTKKGSGVKKQEPKPEEKKEQEQGKDVGSEEKVITDEKITVVVPSADEVVTVETEVDIKKQDLLIESVTETVTEIKVESEEVRVTEEAPAAFEVADDSIQAPETEESLAAGVEDITHGNEAAYVQAVPIVTEQEQLVELEQVEHIASGKSDENMAEKVEEDSILKQDVDIEVEMSELNKSEEDNTQLVVTDVKTEAVEDQQERSVSELVERTASVSDNFVHEAEGEIQVAIEDSVESSPSMNLIENIAPEETEQIMQEQEVNVTDISELPTTATEDTLISETKTDIEIQNQPLDEEGSSAEQIEQSILLQESEVERQADQQDGGLEDVEVQIGAESNDVENGKFDEDKLVSMPEIAPKFTEEEIREGAIAPSPPETPGPEAAESRAVADSTRDLFDLDVTLDQEQKADEAELQSTESEVKQPEPTEIESFEPEPAEQQSSEQELVEPELLEPEPTGLEPSEPESAEQQPSEPELVEAEPTDPEPAEQQLSEPEPAELELVEAEPTELQPSEPELEPEPEPAEPELVEAEPTELEPSEPEPAEQQPSEPEPAELELVEAEPMKLQPSEPEPAEQQPSEPEPAELEPVQAESMDLEPSEPEPAEQQPSESEPAELELVEAEPKELQSSEPDPAEQQLSEPEPAEPEPVEPEPTELEPSETKPSEQELEELERETEGDISASEALVTEITPEREDALQESVQNEDVPHMDIEDENIQHKEVEIGQSIEIHQEIGHTENEFSVNTENVELEAESAKEISPLEDDSSSDRLNDLLQTAEDNIREAKELADSDDEASKISTDVALNVIDKDDDPESIIKDSTTTEPSTDDYSAEQPRLPNEGLTLTLSDNLEGPRTEEIKDNLFDITPEDLSERESEEGRLESEDLNSSDLIDQQEGSVTTQDDASNEQHTENKFEEADPSTEFSSQNIKASSPVYMSDEDSSPEKDAEIPYEQFESENLKLEGEMDDQETELNVEHGSAQEPQETVNDLLGDDEMFGAGAQVIHQSVTIEESTTTQTFTSFEEATKGEFADLLQRESPLGYSEITREVQFTQTVSTNSSTYETMKENIFEKEVTGEIETGGEQFDPDHDSFGTASQPKNEFHLPVLSDEARQTVQLDQQDDEVNEDDKNEEFVIDRKGDGESFEPTENAENTLNDFSSEDQPESDNAVPDDQEGKMAVNDANDYVLVGPPESDTVSLDAVEVADEKHDTEAPEQQEQNESSPFHHIEYQKENTEDDQLRTDLSEVQDFTKEEEQRIISNIEGSQIEFGENRTDFSHHQFSKSAESAGSGPRYIYDASDDDEEETY